MLVAPRAAPVWPSNAEEGGGGIDLADFCFGGDRRLRQADEFSSVFAARRVLRGDYFDLHYSAGSEEGARLGLVIAKRLARRAVQRNLLKRIGREVFRHARPGLPAYNLVLRLAKPPGDSLDTTARRSWRGDIERLLARLPR